MAIKVGEKDLFPYLGDYGPVSIYKGEQKLAGYKWAEKSGRELHFDNTYNSLVEVEVDGQSYQKNDEPTPDNPSEIHSLNDFDVVSSAVRRNLVIPSNVTPGYRIQSDGSIVREVGPFITDFIEVKADEFYTISMLLQKNGYSRVAYYDVDKNFIKRDIFQNQEVTQIKPEQDGFIRWSPDVDNSINDYTPGYIIELGTDHPLIDKINLSLSEPLRSVGDAKDRLFRDSNGLWKIERNIRETIVYSADINGRAYTNTSSFSTQLSGKKSGVSALRTNRFKTVDYKTQSGGIDEEGISGNDVDVYPEHIYIRINRERLIDTESGTLDNWLSTNPLVIQYQLSEPSTETLDQELQDQLNTLKSFKGSNYVYTVQNTDNPHKEQLKPTLHATFNSNDYLKETRTVTNLLIWAGELSDEELIHHNQLFLNRFNLPSDRAIGEPIEQTLNLLHGGMVGHSLEQNYTINI